MFCRKCKTEKNELDFYGKWTPSKWCRQCCCQYNQLWRKKNPTKNQLYCLNWYRKNHPNYQQHFSGLTIEKLLEYKGKATFVEVAEIFKISRQRVHQIWKKYFPDTKFRNIKKKGGSR